MILITAASIGVALGLQNAGVVDKIAGTLLSVSEPMGKPVFTQILINFKGSDLCYLFIHVFAYSVLSKFSSCCYYVGISYYY